MLANALFALLSAQITLTPAPAKGAVPAAPAAEPRPKREIVVQAGKYDRQDSLVEVELQPQDANAGLSLRDQSGSTLVPIQIDPKGHAMFMVKSLKAGTQAKYVLAQEGKDLSIPHRARVQVDMRVPSVYKLRVDNKEILELQGNNRPVRPGVPANLVRGGYIHPVLTPAGAIVTDVYPEDQPRHLGIWSYWQAAHVGNVNVDFWQKPGDSGLIAMESMGPTWQGPVHGGFEMRQIYTGLKELKGATLIHEVIRVSAYAPIVDHKPYFIFDVESEQSSSNKITTDIPKGTGGGIAFRGPREWTAALKRLSSEGGPNAPRPRWRYLGGETGGKPTGVAILGHPGNPNAPQFLVDGGSKPTMCFSAAGGGGLKVVPGKPLVQRYRFVTMDGAPDAKLLERLWRDFASPPTARVVEKESLKPARQTVKQ
jgi:hypothetical protein